MTDQINDQISAFIDDELSDEESGFLLRRFERDSDAREQAVRYTMIGAALRGELLGPDHAVLRRRVAIALTGQPLPAARPAAPRVGARYVRPLLGFGIAASVAVAAIVGLRALNDARVAPGGGTGAETALNVAPLQVQRGTAPASYVVPKDVADGPVVPPAIRLTNYLVHHGEYASRLSRTSVHSNVVGAAEGVVETQLPQPRVDTE